MSLKTRRRLWCVVCLMLAPTFAVANSITNWTGASDFLWTEAANWDAGVPGSTHTAVIANATANPVLLSVNATVGGLQTGVSNSLTISNAALQTGTLSNAGAIRLDNGTLTLAGSGPFTNSGLIQATGTSSLDGSLTNTGTIRVGDWNAPGVLELTGGNTYTNNGRIGLWSNLANSYLVLSGGGTVTLAGTGELEMSGSDTSAGIGAVTSGMTLVNAAGHTISGAGMIVGQALNFENAGTVRANAGEGILFYSVDNVVNTGTMEADGAVLDFGAHSVNNASGVIRAAGGTVTFGGGTVAGGTVAGGTLDVAYGGTMNVGSAVTGAAVNIASGGTLVLQDGAISGGTVTNSGTITGAGKLGANVTNTNAGIISVVNSPLELTGGSTYTNNGRIELVASDGFGALGLSGGGTVTLAGTGELVMGSTQGTGIANIDPNMTLANAAGHTIKGAGMIVGTASGFVFENAGTVAATSGEGILIGADVINTGTIEAVGAGLGIFNGNVNNAGGVIRAGSGAEVGIGGSLAGGTLDVVNGGTMGLGSAVTSATLDIASGGTANVGGTYTGGSINNGGMLVLQAGTIADGTVTNSGTISGSGKLAGNVTNTNAGVISVLDANLEFTSGSTYTNNGLITLNASQSTGLLGLTGGGTVTLEGTGELVMGNTDRTAIIGINPNTTLVNAAGHTISGAGAIGSEASGFVFQNAGTVVATSSGAIRIVGDVINTGTIEATGGDLLFYNADVGNAGVIRARGRQVHFANGTLVGGTLDVLNGGTMSFGSAVTDAALSIASGGIAYLDNATYSGGSIDVRGSLVLRDGATSGGAITNYGTIGGTGKLGGDVTNTDTGVISIVDSEIDFTGGSSYTNNGLITLNASQSIGVLGLSGGGTVTLAGTGELVMGSATGTSIAALDPGMTLVNTAGHTIRGAGVIGTGASGLVFQNAGTVKADGTDGIVITYVASVVNTGTMEAAGAGLTFYHSNVNNTGGLIRANGAQVTFTNSPLAGGTLDVLNGGTMSFNSPVTGAALDIASGGTAHLYNTTYSGGSINSSGTLYLGGATISGTTVNVQSPGTAKLIGNVTNNGTITVAGGGVAEITGDSTITNNGTIALNSGAETGPSTLRLTGAVGATLTGSGSLGIAGANVVAADPNTGLLNASGHTIQGSGTFGGSGNTFAFKNEGTLAVTGAGMAFGPQVQFVNFYGGALSEGTYHVAAAFQFTGADIVTNNAGIILDGSGAGIYDENGNHGLRNFSSNTGSFAARNGAQLPTLGSFTNSGEMEIGLGVTLAASDYLQTAGSTIINGTLSSDVTLEGGTLSGTGSVDGSILNTGGEINPGCSPGPMYIADDFVQTVGGILNIELLSPAAFDQLIIDGAATLGGTLNILLATGFQPAAGTIFTIMQFASREGTFDVVNLPNAWSRLSYEDSQVLFRYDTPEPASWLLLAGGLAWIVRRRALRRTKA